LTISRIFFSADEDYLATATAELRHIFPSAVIEPLGPDLASFEDEGVSIASIATEVRTRHLAFTRHLMRGVGQAKLSQMTDLESAGEIALECWQQIPLPAAVSLHVWMSGHVDLPYRTDELWKHLAETLTEEGISVARGGQPHILSACVTPKGIVFGSNGSANALTDWPGGRVRLAKPKGQISRAEFKLEELFRDGDVALPGGGTALDLGASPGGWSRILLERGFEVWAVDPAELDRRLANAPKLHHVQTTAGPFLADTNETFDLIVNDMRMMPGLSASVMNSAARKLAPNGLAIMTLKLSPRDALHTVRDTFRVLRRSYEIVFARQLHHNRNEITVVARLKGRADG
jgi:23S rRNA (cytidine2498-2'-O)-methyltransferase